MYRCTQDSCCAAQHNQQTLTWLLNLDADLINALHVSMEQRFIITWSAMARPCCLLPAAIE
jgi:hypothetical protein